MPRPSSKFDLALDPGKDHALVLRRQLLTWWQAHGRKDPAQKPWMVTADGCWPLLDQALDPYGVLVPQHCVSSCRARLGWQGPERLCTSDLRVILRLEVFP